MTRDHKPYWLKELFRVVEHWYARHFVRPHFESLGEGHDILKPWNVRVYGLHINVGRNAHIISDTDRKVSFSTWTMNNHQGHITLGNNVLICPGTRFDSASNITAGDNCMFAAGSYITDADWHDIYDRTEVVGVTSPVILGQNVWIGDGATVCKGVTIGANSVIGAGSVVTSDIPANVIAAGNPARVVKVLDEGKPLVTRARLFENPDKLKRDMQRINQYILGSNTLLGWLRVKLAPRSGD